jgi:hypothetical protein
MVRVTTVCYEITVRICITQGAYGDNLDWRLLSTETEDKFLQLLSSNFW